MINQECVDILIQMTKKQENNETPRIMVTLSILCNKDSGE